MTAALEWDYSDLAAAYGKRPDYAERAIDRMLASAGLIAGATACDVGPSLYQNMIGVDSTGVVARIVSPGNRAPFDRTGSNFSTLNDCLLSDHRAARLARHAG